MKLYLILYVVTLIVMMALDSVWIGVIARDFYKNRIGDQLEFHAFPAIIFYLLYSIGIIVFVSGNGTPSWQSTLFYGAFFGLVAYAAYDLTNLATLRGWSLSLCIVDMAWGAVVTALAATAGRLMANCFAHT